MNQESPLKDSPDHPSSLPASESNPSIKQSPPLSFSDLFQLWQHFANVGGADKDRMVAMTSFLLPLLIAATAYSAKLLLTTTTCNPRSFLEVTIVAGCTTLGAYLTTILVLMYAGYANWNWSRADDIAQGLLLSLDVNAIPQSEVNPDQAQATLHAIQIGLHPHFSHATLAQVLRPQVPYQMLRPKPFGRLLRKLSRHLSSPHNPKTTFAPIFSIFSWATILLMLINLLLTGLSLALALRCMP